MYWLDKKGSLAGKYVYGDKIPGNILDKDRIKKFSESGQLGKHDPLKAVEISGKDIDIEKEHAEEIAEINALYADEIAEINKKNSAETAYLNDAFEALEAENIKIKAEIKESLGLNKKEMIEILENIAGE